MGFFNVHGDPTMDPYTILKLPNTASDAEIKKAYRLQMLQLHPDKLSPTLSEESIAAVTEKFHNVKDAYEFLTNPMHLTSRRMYMTKMASRRAEYERREAFMRRNGMSGGAAAGGVHGYHSGGGGAAGMAGTGMPPPGYVRRRDVGEAAEQRELVRRAQEEAQDEGGAGHTRGGGGPEGREGEEGQHGREQEVLQGGQGRQRQQEEQVQIRQAAKRLQERTRHGRDGTEEVGQARREGAPEGVLLPADEAAHEGSGHRHGGEHVREGGDRKVAAGSELESDNERLPESGHAQAQQGPEEGNLQGHRETEVQIASEGEVALRQPVPPRPRVRPGPHRLVPARDILQVEALREPRRDGHMRLLVPADNVRHRGPRDGQRGLHGLLVVRRRVGQVQAGRQDRGLEHVAQEHREVVERVAREGGAEDRIHAQGEREGHVEVRRLPEDARVLRRDEP
ncbi:hypothetical protein THAOC_26889 [Thalassiosira oceanica]|uniref:J domain-containing protein n=1 Tax=Thalassiosira oceanica TaxID=159749 RepID=K0S429_THAOC|nr:hypothetical protein THAOC_26889 [Thalassiosira oceanica]|eukprot:EJK53632.1 hypothetical protein THAOC_26889 [Thalassiosira oceanica]